MQLDRTHTVSSADDSPEVVAEMAPLLDGIRVAECTPDVTMGGSVGNLMVQVMEAWFLADQQTLSAYYGQGFLRNALPRHIEMDAMLTLASNKPPADGVAPDRNRIRKEFPHFGEPYTKAEQAGVTPVPRPARK